MRTRNHQIHIIIALCVALLAAVACNMSSTVVTTPSPTTEVTVQPTASHTPTVTVTHTPSPTVTARSVVPTAQIPPACDPRTDWPLYTVVAGDTLAAIARRSNTTVSILSTANCLEDANNISVGLQLHVPFITPTSTAPAPVASIESFVLSSGYPPQLIWQTRNVSEVLVYVSDSNGDNRLLGSYPGNWKIPSPITSGVATFRLNIKDMNSQLVVGSNGLPVYAIAQTSGGPVEPVEPECPVADAFGSGQITISPMDGAWSNCIYLNPNQTVTITWDEIPPTIQRIEYYFIAVDGLCDGRTHGNPDVIASDSNTSDGNAVNWFVGSGPCSGILYAFGYPGTGLIQSPQRPIVVR